MAIKNDKYADISTTGAFQLWIELIEDTPLSVD